MIVFFIAGLAEIRRPPFDMPIADSELVFGYLTEYTGLRFAFFLLAEYVGIVVIAALTTVLFLGGWHGPVRGRQLGWLWTLLKIFAVSFVIIWLRVSLSPAARGPAAAALLAGPGAGGAGPAGADRRREGRAVVGSRCVRGCGDADRRSGSRCATARRR